MFERFVYLLSVFLLIFVLRIPAQPLEFVGECIAVRVRHRVFPFYSVYFPRRYQFCIATRYGRIVTDPSIGLAELSRLIESTVARRLRLRYMLVVSGGSQAW